MKKYNAKMVCDNCHTITDLEIDFGVSKRDFIEENFGESKCSDCGCWLIDRRSY